MKTINIAQDYTKYPTGRYSKNGKGSGEEFREKYLLEAIKLGERFNVNIDGTSGYSSSFLEEAFGGLVRKGFSAEELRNLLTIEASLAYEPYKKLIWQYIDNALPNNKQ